MEAVRTQHPSDRRHRSPLPEAQTPPTAEKNLPEAQTPPTAEKDSLAIRTLLEERRDAVREATKWHMQAWKDGRYTLDELLDDLRRLLETELALASKPADQPAAYQKHFDQMKSVGEIVKELDDRGLVHPKTYFTLKAACLEAEVRLLREEPGGYNRTGRKRSAGGPGIAQGAA